MSVLKKGQAGCDKISSETSNLQLSIRNLQEKIYVCYTAWCDINNVSPVTLQYLTIIKDENDYETSSTLCDNMDEELSTTEQSVEAVGQRIQGMLAKSYENDARVRLDVNLKMLSSCAGFMQALKDLMMSARNLLEEISKDTMVITCSSF